MSITLREAIKRAIADRWYDKEPFDRGGPSEEQLQRATHAVIRRLGQQAAILATEEDFDAK